MFRVFHRKIVVDSGSSILHPRLEVSLAIYVYDKNKRIFSDMVDLTHIKSFRLDNPPSIFYLFNLAFSLISIDAQEDQILKLWIELTFINTMSLNSRKQFGNDILGSIAVLAWMITQTWFSTTDQIYLCS